jgi:RNA polymerase sigma-70 factor (ECF subfamily)
MNFCHPANTLFIVRAVGQPLEMPMAEPIERLYWDLAVVRCQLGDPAAFEELIAYYQPRLHHFLATLLSDRTGVDDVAQEVWIDVFRDVPKLAEPRAFRAWLYRIARNRALQSLRRRRRPPAPLDGAEIADPDESSLDLASERSEVLDKALGQLHPEHRAVVLMRYIDEMSYADIATATDCPIGTVKSRLYNAKRQLRQILNGREPS